ncbi:MAG: ATP-binding cassette domain-containing protein [Ignavibacteriales bacterium]|nr:ATP-binding cassette domain-containing protein [Ignavibacteriales bacterium]
METASGPLGLTFEDVTFAYNGSDSVLNDLSFDLKPGSVLGLLGRTGSGKTTLGAPDLPPVRRQRRAASSSTARICAKRSLDALAPQHRHRHPGCAAVPRQRPRQPDLLRPLDPRRTDHRHARRTGTRRLVPLPAQRPGHRTRDRRSSLSAGEAQLLAFTRVFLRNPGLVILDEASSRLDPATEQQLERAIDKLLQEPHRHHHRPPPAHRPPRRR